MVQKIIKVMVGAISYFKFAYAFFFLVQGKAENNDTCKN